MLIDIDKIIVRDRIRKDFGDIAELADDIKENGLINPITVDQNYNLMAGERRLRAMKMLGWKQVEVRVVPVSDDERRFNIEVSENIKRKQFGGKEIETIAMMKYQKMISKQGKRNDLTSSEKSKEVPPIKATAEKFGVGVDEVSRRKKILEHKAEISPSDFANWDDGKLSTNKLYNQIKKQKRDLVLENQALKEAHQKLVQKNARLQSELDDREPEVRVVEKKIIPDDYEHLKKELSDSKRSEMLVAQERQKYLEELRAAKTKITELETRDGEKDRQKKLEMEAEFFTNYVNDFVQKIGGYVWVADSVDKLPESKRKSFVQSVINIDGWAQAMIRNMGGTINERKE